MNKSIEDRMQNVETELKQLRKEMEESIARYKAVQDGEKMPYYPFTYGDISKFRSGQIGETEEPVGFIPMTSQQWRDYLGKSWEEFKIKDTKCLWDSIPIEDRMKPMGLSCPCRKCSTYC